MQRHKKLLKFWLKFVDTTRSHEGERLGGSKSATTDGGFSLLGRSRPMSIEFLNTVIGCLFFGVWLIVGHIMTVDYF